MRNLETPNRPGGAAPAAFSIALALALSGCASSGEKSAASSVWDRTVQGVSSAYDATKTAVTSTIHRIAKDQREGWEEMEKQKEAPPAKPAAPAVRAPEPRPPDRLPSARPTYREEDIGRSPQPARTSESRRIALLPRIPQAPEQIRARMAEIDRILGQDTDPAARQRLAAEREGLSRALQASLEEESLIREMERLRARLRRLQERLNEVQRARQ
ncbi:MAG: hypothetical protein HYZ11_14025 [Candidatus Tectomicrobia bacterium]|uniref:Uncharacterized protein n=1 Tax=Tectimicrobiota bacterium TaxID=2528274 RepID=A0A932I2S3_UNCTE|nr:hypothetical protein [Candidatus Tectomicrobia bacterium]